MIALVVLFFLSLLIQLFVSYKMSKDQERLCKVKHGDSLVIQDSEDGSDAMIYVDQDTGASVLLNSDVQTYLRDNYAAES